MARPTPSLMPPSLTTNGTTRITTSGALKPGAKTEMSTELQAMARPLPLPTLTDTATVVLLARDTTANRATVARLPRAGRAPLPPTVLPRVATTTMPGPSKPTDLTTTPDGASHSTPSMPSPTTVNGTQDQ